MAAKKIGAIIALDGEKEFKQNVTSCNKSLSALKSEMGLVKAQCEGQENSLESLQKKHETLAKILDEQKNKEAAVRKGLEHATESYDKMGSRLEELRKNLDTAKKKLTEMGESSDTSAEDIKRQQERVEELSAALQKSEKNYQTAENRIKDWETKLNTAEAQVIRATAAVNKNTSYMKEAEGSTDNCAKSIDRFGKEVKDAEKVTVSFGTVIKTNLENALVDLGKGALSEVGKSVLSLESAQKQLQASTGASATEMRQYNSVMEELHNNNFGDDINDVAQSMALVKQYTNELEPKKLEEMTENGIAMRDVFDMDLSETIRGVDSLVENMGLTSEEAFDLMAKGAQNGLNKSGELADNITEYSQLWGQAGFSAKEMFTILDNGLSSGAYNLDKVNDFVKEFTISLSDGRIEQNLDSFSGGTKSLFYQWKSGKATAKDVFYSVIQDLAGATNQQEALTLASNTWSALGEDNAMKVITSLANTNTAYEDVKGTMEEIKDIKYDTLESRIQQLGKKIQTEVGAPIAEDIMPKLEDGLDAIIDNMDVLIPLVTGIGVSFGTFKLATKAVESLQTAISGTSAAQEGLNIAAKASPYILATTVILGAVTAYETLKDRLGKTSAELDKVAERNQKVCDTAKEAAGAANDLMSSYSESSSDLQAQGEYAKTLADNIETLAGNINRSNAETELMQSYITELNQMVPDLNLSYDEQAGKLSLASDAINEYIDSSMREIEANAAKEYAIELIEKRTKLEIEKNKLAAESEELSKQQTELNNSEAESIEKTAEARIHLGYQNLDNQKSYKELAGAQKENKEASDEVNVSLADLEAEYAATQQKLEEYGVSVADATLKTDENTQSVNENADAQQAAADTNATAVQTIVETYTGMQQTVSEVLESQMDMFEEFKGNIIRTQEDLDTMTENVLNNMQSQVDGVTLWADNMSLLAERGVDQGILQKLAEMGPEGVEYVQAFANMSDDELKKATELWQESLDMKAGVEESVAGMIEQYTVSLSGGAEKVAEVMESVGVDVSTGLGSGIKSAMDQGVIAVNEMGTVVINAARTTFDSHSPSKVFVGIGGDVVTGLRDGINEKQSIATSEISTVTNKIISIADLNLGKARFVIIGKNVTQGLADGIEDRELSAVSSMNSVVTSVKLEASDLGYFTLYGKGEKVAEGLADGIESGESDVINAVARLCQAAVYEAEEQLEINSPSKVFERLGGFTAEGFGVGYEKEMQNVNAVIADSMEIPEVRTVGISGGTAGSSDIIEMLALFQEYLPYLAEIARKDLSLYPSKRKYEMEIAKVANSGLEVIRRRVEGR